MSDETILPEDNQDPIVPTTQVEDDIFGKDQAHRVEQKQNEDMMLVDRTMMADIMKQLNELKGNSGPVDLGDLKKQKRIIRVPIWTDEETGEEFLVTGLIEKVGRDGSRVTTWNRGTEENDQGNTVAITWIKPIMVNLKTKIVEQEKEIRYDTFSNLIVVVPVEVEREHKEEIDMTPKASLNETVEQASYEDKGGYYKRVGTGVMVKVKVWGVKSTFYVNYEGTEYAIDQSVVNYK